jgi:hypothetical protein
VDNDTVSLTVNDPVDDAIAGVTAVNPSEMSTVSPEANPVPEATNDPPGCTAVFDNVNDAVVVASDEDTDMSAVAKSTASKIMADNR